MACIIIKIFGVCSINKEERQTTAWEMLFTAYSPEKELIYTICKELSITVEKYRLDCGASIK